MASTALLQTLLGSALFLTFKVTEWRVAYRDIPKLDTKYSVELLLLLVLYL